MTSTLPIQINLDPAAPPQYSLTMLDRALGPLSESLEVRIQDELKAAFHRRCRSIGRDMSERMRELMAVDAYGADHVHTLLRAQLDVIAVGAPVAVTPAALVDVPGPVRAG